MLSECFRLGDSYGGSRGGPRGGGRGGGDRGGYGRQEQRQAPFYKKNFSLLLIRFLKNLNAKLIKDKFISFIKLT